MEPQHFPPALPHMLCARPLALCRAVTPDLMAGLQAFGPGSGAILLDDVVCPTGSESSLDQGCRHAAWGVSNCAHTADAAVACFDKAKLGALYRVVGSGY